MDPLLKKLNFKDQAAVALVNVPAEQTPLAERFPSEAKAELGGERPVDFLLTFVTRQEEIDALTARFGGVARGDPVIWIAYPKGSSKRYTADFNRDTGWDKLGAEGFEPVRRVAIDLDWSALRFRRVEHIKKLTRARRMAMTDEGRERTSGT